MVRRAQKYLIKYSKSYEVELDSSLSNCRVKVVTSTVSSWTSVEFQTTGKSQQEQQRSLASDLDLYTPECLCICVWREIHFYSPSSLFLPVFHFSALHLHLVTCSRNCLVLRSFVNCLKISSHACVKNLVIRFSLECLRFKRKENETLIKLYQSFRAVENQYIFKKTGKWHLRELQFQFLSQNG